MTKKKFLWLLVALLGMPFSANAQRGSFDIDRWYEITDAEHNFVAIRSFLYNYLQMIF